MQVAFGRELLDQGGLSYLTALRGWRSVGGTVEGPQAEATRVLHFGLLSRNDRGRGGITDDAPRTAPADIDSSLCERRGLRMVASSLATVY